MFHIVLHHQKHCTCIYQGVLLSCHLRYLNNAVSSQIHKKYNWQHASVELAIYTAHVEGGQAGQECYCMHYVITRCGQK